MAVKKENPVEKVVPTPEEKAARKAALATARLNKDRANMLGNVQTCLRQAQEAIAAGNVERHNEWLSATNAALASYAAFAKLTAPAAPANEVSTDPFAG